METTRQLTPSPPMSSYLCQDEPRTIFPDEQADVQTDNSSDTDWFTAVLHAEIHYFNKCILSGKKKIQINDLIRLTCQYL